MKNLIFSLFAVSFVFTRAPAYGSDFPEKYQKIMAVNIHCVDANGGPAKVDLVPRGLVSRFWDDDGEANYYNRYDVTITGIGVDVKTFEMRRFGFDDYDKFFRGGETVDGRYISLVSGFVETQDWNPIRIGFSWKKVDADPWGDEDHLVLSCQFEGALPPLL